MGELPGITVIPSPSVTRLGTVGAGVVYRLTVTLQLRLFYCSI